MQNLDVEKQIDSSSKTSQYETAQFHIDLFFVDKLLGDDPVPFEILHQPHYVNLVLEAKITECEVLNKRSGVDAIYQAIDSGNDDNDIKKLISLLDECAKKKIPHAYKIGIIIMYLEICEGYKIL